MQKFYVHATNIEKFHGIIEAESWEFLPNIKFA